MGFYFANAKRTRKAIADAFIGLFETKPFEKITIQNILTFAEISRSTFYKYFVDKYDLTRQITETLVEGYAQILIEHKEKAADGLFPYTYRYILENKREFKALLSVKNSELDVFHEIIHGLCAIYPQVGTVIGEYETVEAYYFAYNHFVTIYCLVISDDTDEDAPPPRVSEYTDRVTGSILNVFSDCFKLDVKSLKHFIDANKKI